MRLPLPGTKPHKQVRGNGRTRSAAGGNRQDFHVQRPEGPMDLLPSSADRAADLLRLADSPGTRSPTWNSRKSLRGFGFLQTTAGFGIIQSLVEYSETSSYGRGLIVGLLNTLLIAFIGIILATILGFVMGVARLSQNWIIARMAYVYIEIVRNIPLLLQIFLWYFAVLRALPDKRGKISFLGFHLNIVGLPRSGAGLRERFVSNGDRLPVRCRRNDLREDLGGQAPSADRDSSFRYSGRRWA